ncbi:hypothetical protein [Lacihabitans sp. LS3-19]|nr:hypothetical protein [Lacihabitans sp. LS3-19]
MKILKTKKQENHRFLDEAGDTNFSARKRKLSSERMAFPNVS